MKYFIEILLIGITILTAWWHSRLIKAGRPINHSAWALGAGAAILLGIIFAGVSGWSLLAYLIAQLSARLVVFNLSLNRFRGLPWFYSSATSGSELDKIQRKLFGSRIWELEALLVLIFITLQFFI